MEAHVNGPARAILPGAPLSAGDRAELARLERVIDRGRDTFREVAFALLEIRDRRLYRAEFSSFADYCRERWGFSVRYGNRLIQAAELVQECEAEGRPAPANECQARRMLEARREPAPIGAEGNGQAEASGRAGADLAAKIGKHLERLKQLHASHPKQRKADVLLGLYRAVVLPWPA